MSYHYDEGFSKTPKYQKFPIGTRVRIKGSRPCYKEHFVWGTGATVEYTYAQAYGGGKEEARTYRLNVDGHGSLAWYDERHLEPLKETDDENA